MNKCNISDAVGGGAGLSVEGATMLFVNCYRLNSHIQV